MPISWNTVVLKFRLIFATDERQEVGIDKKKNTQPNSMIMVSFSSAEDALFNDVKYGIFCSQGTENPPFRFFGTPGIVPWSHKLYNLQIITLLLIHVYIRWWRFWFIQLNTDLIFRN